MLGQRRRPSRDHRARVCTRRYFCAPAAGVAQDAVRVRSAARGRPRRDRKGWLGSILANRNDLSRHRTRKDTCMTDLPRRHQRVVVTPAVRHGRLPRRHAAGRVVRILAGVLAVVLVSVGSVAAYAVWDVARSIKTGVHLAALPGHTRQSRRTSRTSARSQAASTCCWPGPTAAAGWAASTTRADEQDASSGAGNNDVTMLLHIAQDHKSMMVVSFPRDLMVAIPDCPTPDGKGTVDGVELRPVQHRAVARRPALRRADGREDDRR